MLYWWWRMVRKTSNEALCSPVITPRRVCASGVKQLVLSVVVVVVCHKKIEKSV